MVDCNSLFSFVAFFSYAEFWHLKREIIFFFHDNCDNPILMKTESQQQINFVVLQQNHVMLKYDILNRLQQLVYFCRYILIKMDMSGHLKKLKNSFRKKFMFHIYHISKSQDVWNYIYNFLLYLKHSNPNSDFFRTKWLRHEPAFGDLFWNLSRLIYMLVFWFITKARVARPIMAIDLLRFMW